MNKFYLTICFCLSFLLLLSCGRPDLTEEVESAYDYAKGNSGSGSSSDTDSSSGSCTTIDGNMWSPRSSSEMIWDDAVSYCDNLTACGYSDWHLPTISELRTLIQNCSGTVTGGSCGVTDSCLSSSCWSEESCHSCSYEENGGHSKLGDTGWFWSSSVRSDSSDDAWFVHFSYGYVFDYSLKHGIGYVRCVR